MDWFLYDRDLRDESVRDINENCVLYPFLQQHKKGDKNL